MNILSVTAETWQLAGISVGVVFTILLALVAVLGIFTIVAKKTKEKTAAVTNNIVSNIQANQQAKAVSGISEQDKAAIATAVYLYFNDDHDHESGVLTINNTPSNWGHVLNPRL
ncbi:MAG: OadG family protein [Bacteroidaceae bacterium]|nr:OadG family protein [Bacteroidaceae bacterium]